MALLGFSPRLPLHDSFISIIKSFSFDPKVHYVVRDSAPCSESDAGCHIVFNDLKNNTATLVGNIDEARVELIREPDRLVFIERPIISSTINVFSLNLNTGLIVGTKNVETMMGNGFGAVYTGYCKATRDFD